MYRQHDNRPYYRPYYARSPPSYHSRARSMKPARRGRYVISSLIKQQNLYKKIFYLLYIFLFSI